MRIICYGRRALVALAFFFGGLLPLSASPWAEVGDGQLRADLELLKASGVIHGLTVQWPLPWQSLLGELGGADLAAQPATVRAAAQRLLAKVQTATAPGNRAGLYADVTNQPSVVYGFDGMGRGEGQAQLSFEHMGDIFSGRASLGGFSRNFGPKGNKVMPDGTYLSLALGGVRLYAGYLDHWWGPGEISALQLSNNARPMPQIGIARASTEASSWPVLNWLGPWQFEFFLGRLDGPQIQANVDYSAARLTIAPFEGLEIGLAKTEQFCGRGHPCAPLRDYFTNFDFSNHPDNVNGEGAIDIKYSSRLWGVPVQAYAQMMNEDYSWVSSSGSSYLVGTSVFLPAGDTPLKLTLEYADTIATRTPFSFGNNIYGYTYNNSQYPDGMHYRGRTLGFSLDSDSTLLSLRGNWSDADGRFYEISLHHATIASSEAPHANILTVTPLLLNMGEARVSLLSHCLARYRGRISPSIWPAGCRTTSRDRMAVSRPRWKWRCARLSDG
jgi:hypothetical protein